MTDLAEEIRTLSKEFCRQNGICWHEEDFDRRGCWCRCGKYLATGEQYNLDFSDAREVLKVIDDGKGRLPQFLKWLVDKNDLVLNMTPSWLHIADLVMDETGLLLQEAVEWGRDETKKTGEESLKA